MKKRIFAPILALLLLLTLSLAALAHPGRTDSRGGHRDNKNKSGLGSYHYHCGGYPPHLHPGGVCPYTSNNTSYGSSGSSSLPGNGPSSDSPATTIPASADTTIPEDDTPDDTPKDLPNDIPKDTPTDTPTDTPAETDKASDNSGLLLGLGSAAALVAGTTLYIKKKKQ